MAELPPVIAGEPIDSATFGNPVIERVISRYADATERDAMVPVPIAGDPAYLVDTDDLQMYDGAAWISVSDMLPEAASQEIATVFNTTSTAYLDLGGPRGTIDVKSGSVLVLIQSHISNDTPGGSARVSAAASGANTVGATDNIALQFANAGTGTTASLDATVARTFTSLNPGPTTFTAMYRAHITGTATFARAGITIIQI